MNNSSLPSIACLINPPLANPALNALFAAAWPHHTWRDFAPLLAHSLLYVGAFGGAGAAGDGTLVGFVNVAWDGGVHAFLLDTTVHPDYQRRGIGRQLVITAIAAARTRGMAWLHVDYEPHLHAFYASCGFTPTLAGLVALNP